MAPHARRPRFLSQVPENRSPEPAQFARAPASCAPASFHEPVDRQHGGPAAGDGTSALHALESAPSAAPPAPDASALRREGMERLDAAVSTLRAHAERLAEQARADAVEIAFRVAHKILETELSQHPDALFALVRSALRRAGESRRIIIRVAPEDASLLQSDAGRAALDGITATRVEYVVDASLQHGDCVVDADFGQVDGRLSTRLAEVRRAVDSATEGAA